jgi:hypothetical protein
MKGREGGNKLAGKLLRRNPGTWEAALTFHQHTEAAVTQR